MSSPLSATSQHDPQSDSAPDHVSNDPTKLNVPSTEDAKKKRGRSRTTSEAEPATSDKESERPQASKRTKSKAQPDVVMKDVHAKTSQNQTEEQPSSSEEGEADPSASLPSSMPSNSSKTPSSATAPATHSADAASAPSTTAGGEESFPHVLHAADPSANTVSAPPTMNDNNASAQSNANKADPPPQPITMRALIMTTEAAIVIGRAGAHIHDIRDRSNSNLKVSKAVPNNPERILTVTGMLDTVAKAFGLIVRRMNDEAYEQPSSPASKTTTIRLIIPNSAIGVVIGKGGAKIKEIQEKSGARLTANNEPLPHSTERLLDIQGVADAVHIAVYWVGVVLLEHQRYQQNNPRRIANAAFHVGGGHMGGGHMGGPNMGAPNMSMGSPYMYQQAQQQGHQFFPNLPGYGMQAASPMLGGPAGAGQYTHEQIFYVPYDLIGLIIGKGGAKINEIRQQTQASVKVPEAGKDGQPAAGTTTDRVVLVSGPEANVLAAVNFMTKIIQDARARQLMQQQQQQQQAMGMAMGMNMGINPGMPM